MIIKTTYESFFMYHEFRRSDGQGWLNESETIKAGTTPVVKIYEEESGADVTQDMVSDIGIYNSTKVKFLLKGGTAKKFYQIHIQIESSNNQKFEDNSERNPNIRLSVI